MQFFCDLYKYKIKVLLILCFVLQACAISPKKNVKNTNQTELQLYIDSVQNEMLYHEFLDKHQEIYEEINFHLDVIKEDNKKSVHSAYLLGNLYIKNTQLDNSFEHAFYFYQWAADRNFSLAMLELGKIYYIGYMVKKDNKKALLWYKKAAELEEPEAQYMLAKIFEEGLLAPKDEKKAIELYHLAAKNQSEKAQFVLGFMYYYGHNLITQNYERAFDFLLPLAHLSHPLALSFIIDMYAHGKGVSMDKELAFKYYQRLIKLNNGTDQNNAIFNFFSNFAAQGDPYSQYLVGSMYLSGELVQQNYNKALYWLAKASNQGYSSAQVELALLYLLGKGVTKNISLARYWLNEAIQKNDYYGMYILGLLYYKGDIIEKDEKKGMDFLVRAAKYGTANEKYHLGVILLNEGSNNQRLIEAFAWISLASVEGLKEATEILKKKEQLLSKLELRQVDNLAKLYMKLYGSN